MSIQTTLGEPQPKPPKTDKTERDVVFTANGSKRASEVVYRTGALVGMESLNTRPPDKIPVNFVDWPFSKLDDFPDLGELFDAHLGVVERERPFADAAAFLRSEELFAVGLGAQVETRLRDGYEVLVGPSVAALCPEFGRDFGAYFDPRP